MPSFRNRDRSNRSGRSQIEHNVLEGLPINQYREIEVTVGPNLSENKPADKNAWPELPLPRDSHFLPEHSQQILRAARSGRTYKPPPPPEDENELKDEEEEHKEVPTGFMVKKYVKVARHLEGPEPEYLAKRRKGLPSQYANGQLTQAPLRETKVRKLDAEGNVAVYKVLVPEGQGVEGEVAFTDAAIEAEAAVAAPGTVVEGVGVVNAEGVIIANDILQPTPLRRRPPPPKKKVKRAGPGRGKKKVLFADGAADLGTPASGAESDLLAGLKRKDGSVAPSDGGDTPMGEAGEGYGESSASETSEDEDQDMESTSAPTTPAQVAVEPRSARAAEITDEMEIVPQEPVLLPVVQESKIEPLEPQPKKPSSAIPSVVPQSADKLSEEMTVDSVDALPVDALPQTTSQTEPEQEPELKLEQKREPELEFEPGPTAETDTTVVDHDLPIPDATTDFKAAPASAATPLYTILSEAVPGETIAHGPASIEAMTSEAAVDQVAPPSGLGSEPVVEPAPQLERLVEPGEFKPVVETLRSIEPELVTVPAPMVESIPAPILEPESEVVPAIPEIPVALPNEPDLMHSLEAALDKSNEDAFTS